MLSALYVLTGVGAARGAGLLTESWLFVFPHPVINKTDTVQPTSILANTFFMTFLPLLKYPNFIAR
jgi:hypothetical protein